MTRHLKTSPLSLDVPAELVPEALEQLGKTKINKSKIKEQIYQYICGQHGTNDKSGPQYTRFSSLRRNIDLLLVVNRIYPSKEMTMALGIVLFEGL